MFFCVFVVKLWQWSDKSLRSIFAMYCCSLSVWDGAESRCDLWWEWRQKYL